MAITIRAVRVEDGAEIARLRRMPGVFENILSYPSEREELWTEKLKNLDRNLHYLVAVAREEDGSERLAGMAGLTVYPQPRRRHSAGMGLMVHREFQNQGIGSMLLEAILELADQWLMLERVELEVLAGNERALHLYEKFGFRQEGIKKMAVIQNGAYVDEIMMARMRNTKGE